MATKIRRCLYIGLGGTGMGTLLNVKKMFIDNYGEVPPMIGFLGIDTDGGVYKKELDSRYGKVCLSPNEQLPVSVDEARPVFSVYKDHFGWLPEENLYALTSMTLGAGQVRTNGRFAFIYNMRKVEDKVVDAVNRISHADIAVNPRYELLANDVEIHMVFSVCGGTGAGTFIDAAYLVRRCAPKCKLTGYAVLPDVFESMSNSGMAKVKINAFGSIQDLDYLMHLGLDKRPVDFDYIHNEVSVNERPFNAFYFIDNKNENNDVYDHVDRLEEMIALALVTSAGELSTASASVSDNLEKNIREGSMDIEDKKAWVAGMGICEIVFHGQDLQTIYAWKAAKRLTAGLLNSCVDSDAIVNAWIDKPEVNIRENNGFDNVIDFIMPKMPPYPMTDIDDRSNAKPEVEGYLGTVLPKDKEVQDKVNELASRVKQELYNLVVDELNKECGVGTTLEVIQGIMAQVEIFLTEMNQEADEKRAAEPKNQSTVEMALKDLDDYCGRFFKSKTGVQDRVDQVLQATMQLACTRREIIRRNAAINFYTGLKVQLADYYGKVRQILQMMANVINNGDKVLAEIQNSVGRVLQTFQIDLAQKFVTQVVVDDSDILPADFVKTLPGNKVYDFAQGTTDDLQNTLLKYTRSLKSAKKWGDMTIDDVLNKMSEAEFDLLVKNAITRSTIMLRIDHRGFMPQEAPANNFYVGVPRKDASRLFKDDYFKRRISGNADVDFSSIGLNDRVIIYRQLGVVPAYAIAGLAGYEQRYVNRNNYNPHIDANLLKRMKREEFSLQPKATADDSLELWVKGIIFGLVKKEDNVYYYHNEAEGDIIDGHWMKLSEYRDDSFDMFKRQKNMIREEYETFFNKLESEQGTEFLREKLKDVRIHYWEKYSMLGLSNQELKQRGNEALATLFRQELQYVNELTK